MAPDSEKHKNTSYLTREILETIRLVNITKQNSVSKERIYQYPQFKTTAETRTENLTQLSNNVMTPVLYKHRRAFFINKNQHSRI